MKQRGAIAALAVLGLALTAAVAVWALDRPRGLRATPSSIHFGYQEVGRSSPGQIVSVTNHGGRPTVRSIRIVGASAGDFVVTDASTCVEGPFPTNASCTIVVRFAPTNEGERAAILFVSSISGGPGVVLSGTGT